MWLSPIDIQLGGPVLQTSSDRPAEQPTPQTGFLENLRATREEMLLAGNTNAATSNEREAYAPLVEALSGEIFDEGEYLGRPYRRRLLNPATLADEERWGGYMSLPSSTAMKRAIFDRIRRRRQADPGFLKGVPDTFEEYDAQVRQRNAQRLQGIRQVQAGATGLGQLGGFVGGVLGSLEDPLNLATLPFGGSAKTFVGAVARSAGENALVEFIAQPFVAENYRELGEDHDLGDAVRSVLFAGALGAGFRGAGEAVVRLRRGAGPAWDRFAAQVFDRMPESIRERWAKSATIDDQLLADTIRATIPEEQWTTEIRDAVNVLERDAEIAARSPWMPSPEGDDAHAGDLAEALQALIEGTPRPSRASTLMASTSTFAVPPARTARAGALDQDEVIRFVMRDLEGGAEVVRYSQADGGTTKFGIAAKFNSGVDVASLTEDQAAAIYRRDYWFPALDRADPATAAVAFDAGVISGPAVGKRILAASGGDPERAIALYRAHLNRIADTVPGKAKYKRGWNNRVDKLAARLGLAGNGRAEAMPELASLGEARAAGESNAEIAELAEMEAAALARSVDDGPAVRFDDEEAPFFEPAPVLRRELFASDDNWLDAQVRLWAEARPSSSGGRNTAVEPAGAPPAREAGAGPPEAAAAPAAAQRASGAAEPTTAGEFVDAYLRGEGRGDNPRDRELQQFQVDNGSAIEAEFQRRLAAADAAAEPGAAVTLEQERLATGAIEAVSRGSGPLTREALSALARPVQSKPDALWYAGLNVVTNREFGREPGPLWGIRDKRTGELAGWSVNKGQAQKEIGDQWEPDEFALESLTPEAIEAELRARGGAIAAQRDVELASPALERFADPDGDGARLQAEALEHDLRMEAAADPFAPERPDLAGDWPAALALLMREQRGSVPGALEHPEIGKIDVVWGEAGTGRNTGYGLAKIAARHPEVLDDLPAIVAGMTIRKRSEGKVHLISPTHRGAVRLDYDGRSRTWLLTAFARNDAPPAPDIRRGAGGGRDGSPDLEVLDDIGALPDRGNAGSHRLGEEGPEQSLADILAEIDAEEAAIAALKACLAPGRGGG